MATEVYTRLPDEDLLLQQTAEGNRDAFTRLYKHYYHGLYRFVYFISGSQQDAEEVIQEIFLKIWSKKETLISIRSFDDYLFRMAKNCLFDLNRQTQTQLKLLQTLRPLQPRSTGTPLQDLIFQQYNKTAREAIDSLPGRKKQIFLMKSQQDMTAQEIANQLGMSRSAVKKQLFDAIHFIKDHLRLHAEFLLILQFLTCFLYCWAW